MSLLSSLTSWVRWIGLSELFPTLPHEQGSSQAFALCWMRRFAKLATPRGDDPAGNLPPAPAAAPRAQFPVHPRAQGMHGDCPDPLGAGCGRRAGRARPSCRLQPPGTAGLRAVRAAPPAPTPLRMLARCTQWVRGVQVQASSACWEAVLEGLNLPPTVG